jgi:3-oxosteroid 1-dehydrogenase
MGAWDKTVDLLVVGSGAGALTAALRARKAGGDVLIVEKSDRWGGTSATSGGGVWIPNSHLAKAAGAQDSPSEAFTYMRALAGASVPDRLIRAYIEQAPRMLEWLEQNSPVCYLSIPYTDYHAELPGG